MLLPSKQSMLNARSHRSLMFSSTNFTDLGFNFKLTIHFELIIYMVSDMDQVLFFFFGYEYPVVPVPFPERLSLLH